MRKPIDEMPKKVTRRDILRDSDIDLGAHNEFVLANYSSEEARNNLLIYASDKTEITGSSMLANIVLANMTEEFGVLPNKHHLGGRSDMEFLAEKQEGFFNGIYADFGFVLVTGYDNWKYNSKKINDAVAKDLTAQLKHRGIDLPDRGLILPQAIFGLPAEDNNSYYGLMPKIEEQLDTSDVKDQLRNINDSKWISGWTRYEGIARAIRGDLGCGRYSVHLSDSDSCGRVVWAGKVDAPKNFGYEERDRQWRTALEKANLGGAYNVAKQHLSDNN